MKIIILGVFLVTGLFAETVSKVEIASTVGGLAPFIVIFGILSRVIIMNFSGTTKLWLFIALTVIPTIYVYIDIKNNIGITLIIMGLLVIASIVVRMTKKKS